MGNSEDFKALVDEIERAEKAYLSACNVTGEARRNETILLNELNGMQKRLNAMFDKMKAQAPRGSDWKSPEQMAVHP